MAQHRGQALDLQGLATVGELLAAQLGVVSHTLIVDQDPDQGRRQETTGLQAARCRTIQDKEAFEQQLTGGESGMAITDGGTVTGLLIDDQLHAVAYQRVIPGEELSVFMTQGGAAAEGRGEAFRVQSGQVAGDRFGAGMQVVTVQPKGFALHIETVEDPVQIAFQVRILVLLVQQG